MSYELKTNTVVDALNDIYADLAGDGAGKEADTVLEALNNISVELGGSVYTSTPDAVRAVGEHLGEGGSGSAGYTLVPLTIEDNTQYGFYIYIPFLFAVEDMDGTSYAMHVAYSSDTFSNQPCYLMVPNDMTDTFSIFINKNGNTLEVTGADYTPNIGYLTNISTEGVTISVSDGGLA